MSASEGGLYGMYDVWAVGLYECMVYAIHGVCAHEWAMYGGVWVMYGDVWHVWAGRMYGMYGC